MKQDETICLVSLGEVDTDTLSFLQSELEKIFGREVKVAEGLKHPDYAYNPKREQYHSSEILGKMKKEQFNGCDRVLGVGDIDMYVPSKMCDALLQFPERYRHQIQQFLPRM